MPAGRLNYIVIHKDESQVLGTATKSIALETPPPDGSSLEDRRIFFITYQPDTEQIVVHQVPRDEVVNAEIKERKPTKKKKKD